MSSFWIEKKAILDLLQMDGSNLISLKLPYCEEFDSQCAGVIANNFKKLKKFTYGVDWIDSHRNRI